MTQPLIVFDLDGTLVHTAPDLLDSLNFSLAGAGIPPVPAEGFNAFVSFGGMAMIEQAFTRNGKTLTPEARRAFFETFLEHYGSSIPGKSAFYPGVIEALDRFEAAGYKFAICTNKKYAHAVKLIEALKLSHRFVAITGQDSFAFKKPDPRHLLETVALAEGDPGNTIMMGDSQTDIDTAKAAGIPVVAVDFGYTDRHVREFEPSAIISHYDSLTLKLVEQLIALGNHGASPA